MELFFMLAIGSLLAVFVTDTLQKRQRFLNKGRREG